MRYPGRSEVRSGAYIVSVISIKAEFRDLEPFWWEVSSGQGQFESRFADAPL